MNEPTGRGRRLALKFAMIQLACAALVALAFLAYQGANAARSAVAGGLISASGTLVFAWRAFASSWPQSEAVRGFYLGELFKWIWVVGALSLAFTRGGFEPSALLAGFVAAQLGFWVATGMFKK